MLIRWKEQDEIESDLYGSPCQEITIHTYRHKENKKPVIPWKSIYAQFSLNILEDDTRWTYRMRSIGEQYSQRVGCW